MNIYERTSRFFVANPKKNFFLFVIITIGLTLSYLFIPYRGDASTSPKDPIIDLDIKISNQFSDEVHFVLFILEGKNSDDILSNENLLKVFNATEKLRAKDASKNLSPESIIDSEHLYKYIDSDTGVKVNGIFTIADVVNNILIINPKYNKTLKDASNNEVKEIISEVFKGDGFKDIKRNLSTHSNVEKRKINNQEIDWWTSPAMMIAVLGHNDSLGGGSQRVALSGDKITLDKEKFNTNVMNLLKNELKDLNVWGIAIDVNLEGERQGFSSAVYITLTVIAAIAIVGFSLRSYWAVLLIGIGLSTLMIWLKGLSYLFGLKGGLVSDLIVPIAMVAFGVDFGVHAIRRYQEEKRANISYDKKFVIAFTGIGSALTLAFISDAIAFLSNLTAGTESIVHFGLAAGIATFGAYIVLGIYAPFLLSKIESIDNKNNKNKFIWIAQAIGSAALSGGTVITFLLLSPIYGIIMLIANIILFLFLPLYFASKAKESQVVSDLNRDNIFIKIEEKFSALIVFFAKKPIYTILFFSAITIYTTFLAFKLESSFEVKDFFNPESDFVIGLDKLDYHLGDTTGELGVFYFEGDLSEPEAIDDMKSLLITLESKDFLAHDKDGNLLIIEPNLISLLENINSPAINKEENKKNLDKLIDQGLKNDQDETIFPPSRIKTTLIRSNNNYSTVFRVGIPNSDSQNVTTLARKELESELKIFQNKSYISEYGITGSPFVRDVEQSSSRNSLYRSIPIAAVASFLVLLIAFKSFRYAFVTILPIGLVVSWLYGIMYIGGYSLNLVTATIGAISIGVGIDFSIHITQRFREEIRKNNTETALSKTLNGTGIALLGSAISSIAGFIIMGFAPMPMFASFGKLTAIMIFLALISSVFVLPSLLVMVSKKNE
tara:strand:+ start:1073 stop:3745 length:2673 start_codon:yes stop_codon:yes gene_type:complete